MAVLFAATAGCDPASDVGVPEREAVSVAVATAPSAAFTPIPSFAPPREHAPPVPSALSKPVPPPCRGETFRPPPREYRIDTEDQKSPTEVMAVGDIDGDGHEDVSVTTAAFRTVQGNEVRAIYLGDGTCVRFAGHVFGYLLAEPHEPSSARRGMIFTSASGNLHEEEHTEYRVAGGRIVGHRVRGCRTECETAKRRCNEWRSLGGRPLPPDLWDGLAPSPGHDE